MIKTMLLGGVGLNVLLAASAIAQAAPSDDKAATVTEVVVTGSRVAIDGSQAPTPVTVVSAEQLQKASPGTVGEALNQLPVFRGSTRPTTGQASALWATHGSVPNLR